MWHRQSIHKFIFIFVFLALNKSYSPMNMITQAQTPDSIWRLAWSPIGDQVATIIVKGDTRHGNDDLVNIYDAETFQQIGTIPNLKRDGDVVLDNIDWSQDGKYLAISKDFNERPLIEIWQISDVSEYKMVLEYIGDTRTDIETFVKWRPGYNQIAFNDIDAIHVIDMDGNAVRDFTDSGQNSEIDFYTTGIAWNPDGSQILSSGLPGRIWDANSGELRGRLQEDDHFTPAIWSPDGSQIVAPYHDQLRLWDVDSLEPIDSLEGKVDFVGSLKWEGDTIVIATGTPTQVYIYLWDANTKKLVEKVGLTTYPQDITLSPDGTTIIYGSNEELLHQASVYTPSTLRSKVAECVTDNGILTSLNTKIDTNQWQDFINEVEAQRDKQITSECADSLVEMAEFLLENPASEE